MVTRQKTKVRLGLSYTLVERQRPDCGNLKRGGTIPVDTHWMRKEVGTAFQVERSKPQTPRVTPPPQTHTTTIFFGYPLAKSYGRPHLHHSRTTPRLKDFILSLSSSVVSS